MAPEAGVSRGRLLAGGAALLRDAGLAAPRGEARRIWRDLSGEDAGRTLLTPDEAIAADLAERFTDACARRAQGEPLAHVTGWVGFRHLTLRSDRRALIPRPETESLVDLVLARVRRGCVADIGTGGGCIALSLAAEGEFECVIGTDVSFEALRLARENIHRTGQRVSLLQGDLCAPLAAGRLDALVSNPPYLTTAELAALDPSVSRWEPASALASGGDGLAATSRLLEQGRAALRPGGWMALEVDAARAREVAARARALGWQQVSVHEDLFGRERYLLARRSDAR